MTTLIHKKRGNIYFPYLVLDVLNQKGRSPQIIHWEVKEPLNAFGIEIKCDEMRHACFSHHRGQQLTRQTTTLSHFALFGVWKVRDYTNHFPSRGSLTGVTHYQHLHDAIVDRMAVRLTGIVTSLNDEDIFTANRV